MKTCSYCNRDNDDAAAHCFECRTPFPTEHGVAPGWPCDRDQAHEFTAEQKRLIRHVASLMRLVGVVLLTLAGVQLPLFLVLALRPGAASVVALLPLMVGLIMGLIMGSLTMQAGTAFRKMVRTEGNEIAHLMSALGALRSLYFLQVVLGIIGLALAGVWVLSLVPSLFLPGLGF